MNTSWRDVSLAVCRMLGDAMNGRRSHNAVLPDEDALLRFCRSHRIDTLVSSALRTVGIPDGTYCRLHDLAERAAFHQIKSDLTADAVREELTAHGVTVLPLKGAALQAVYPKGWIRTTTDTDFFIRAHQLDTAVTVLTKEGFTQSSTHDGDFCFQKPPRSVIELHTTLGGFTARQKQALDRLTQTAFSVNEHYVYTLFHLYKHVLYAGAGVRMFFDLYCLSRAVTDRDGINDRLDSLSLRGFDRAVQTVNGILFDGAVCPDELSDVIDLVLTSGTFGTSDAYHAMKQASQPITQKNRVHTWLTDYGFDRAAMTIRYPVLERQIWLYPACAAHRILNGLLFKRTVLKDAIQSEHAVDPKRMDRILRALQIL